MPQINIEKLIIEERFLLDAVELYIVAEFNNNKMTLLRGEYKYNELVEVEKLLLNKNYALLNIHSEKEYKKHIAQFKICVIPDLTNNEISFKRSNLEEIKQYYINLKPYMEQNNNDNTNNS
jgi:hypothetical protein